MKRRPLLRALLAAPLALFAPIAALAGRGREESATRERVILDRVRSAERRAEIAESQFRSADCRAKYHHDMSASWQSQAERHPDIALADRLRDACMENARLRAELAATRALLVEAREHLAIEPTEFKLKDGSVWHYRVATEAEPELVARIDALTT